ncbi:MAG: ABC transporter ATP-binding protein, partial [SAR324 cluster bacterium]|nr:ABC transporter ATP-binding protein [SAR324 cluster bacterium]
MMLKLDQISCRYGQVEVLHQVSLHLEQGEILGLLGRNGAGKTTLLKCLMGLLPLVSGKIVMNDEILSGKPAHEIPKKGIGLVPQGRRLFPYLSVEENLKMGLLVNDEKPGLLDWILELFPVLQDRMQQKAGTLSGGEQQMLATARALCIQPKFLLLDEPSEGLMPKYVERIFETVERLKKEKVGILLVEQKIDGVLKISDRVAFLENGNLEHQTTP